MIIIVMTTRLLIEMINMLLTVIISLLIRKCILATILHE